MIETILIDSREPDSVKAMSFDGAATVVSLLEWGDLHVLCSDGALLVIERKTPSDFLNTLKDDRLMPQMAGIKSLSRWAYLLIDGRLESGRDGKTVVDGYETGWQWASVQGALLTAQEMGVNVINSGGDFETTVLWLARHSRAEVKHIYPQKAAIFASPAEQVLASLPGIGEQRATAILSNHGNDLKWALCSLLDPTWEKQPDVGPITKKNLRRLFGLADDQILWPYTNDQPIERNKTK